MPPKKTEGASKPKTASTHASYQVCRVESGIVVLEPATNETQDMITDAIVAV